MRAAEWYAFAMGCVFGAGGFLLLLLPPAPKVCPTVEGQKTITTYHVGDGHYCVYEKSHRGLAKRVTKL